MRPYTDLVEFDCAGAAVGLGRLTVPATVVLPSHDRLGLFISRKGAFGARLYPIFSEPVRGIHPLPEAHANVLELAPSVAQFLRQHLEWDVPAAGSMSITGGTSSFRNPATFSFHLDEGQPWIQRFSRVDVEIAPQGADRAVTVRAVATEPASRYITGADARVLIEEGQAVSATVLISAANRHILFDLPAEREDAEPSTLAVRPTTAIGALDARQVLAARGKLVGWSGGTGSGAVLVDTGVLGMHLLTTNRRRADGIFEAYSNAGLHLNLHLPMIERLLNNRTEARLSLTAESDEIGRLDLLGGRDAVEEGARTRNVEQLDLSLSLSTAGLTMVLHYELGEYLPDSIRARSRPQQSGKAQCKWEISFNWESLIINQLFLWHARRMLEGTLASYSRKQSAT